MRLTWNVSFALCAGLVFLTGCPDKSKPSTADYDHTILEGYAPLNAGGRVRVTMAEPLQNTRVGLDLKEGQQVGEEATVEADGHFLVSVDRAYGAFALEARGGSYREPSTGRYVMMGTEALHATVYDVKPQETVQVPITPWSDLLHAYGTKHPGKNSYVEAQVFLEQALGCGQKSLTTAIPATPQEKTPLESAGGPELAYVHMAVWSKLAKDLGDQAGLNEGVTSIRLVRSIGGSLERTGTIDGSVKLDNGMAVPANILRQPFAQAMRRYLDDKHEHVKLRSNAVTDLLRCTSDAPASMWGPAGEELDLQAPKIVIETPKNGVILTSSDPFTCTATDPSDVVEISADIVHDGNQVKPLLATAPVLKGGHQAVFKSIIDTENLAQGNVLLRCTAKDRWGNEGTETARIELNKGMGKPTIHVAPFEEKLKDEFNVVNNEVTITCTCTGDFIEGLCRLSDESRFPGVRVEGSEGATRSEYRWDTTQVVDGERNLTCEVDSRGRSEALSQTRPVTIHNHDPIDVAGRIFMDTIVTNMKVTAYSYDDPNHPQYLGEALARDGTFTLSLTNRYRGPVLFVAEQKRAGGNSAKYKSLAIDKDVLVGERKLRLLWEDYRPGQSIPELSISGFTDLIEAYSVVLYGDKGETHDDMVQSADQARYAWSQYLMRDVAFDPRTTNVWDFTSKDPPPLARASVRLGLWHVGLSRIAAELSDDMSSLDLLAKMRDDLENGSLDGIGPNGPNDVVMFDQEALTRETLRSGMARAIRSWVDNKAFKKHDSPSKYASRSGINGRQLGRPGEFLPVLAENRSALFGSDAQAGAKFDDDPPVLKVLVRTKEHPDGVTPPLDRPVRGVLYIDVTATDEGGVYALDAFVGEEAVKVQDMGEMPSVSVKRTFIRNTEPIAEGALEVRIVARDGSGNVTDPVFKFDVDNARPKFRLSKNISLDGNSVLRVNDGNVTVQGTASKTFESLTVYKGQDPLTTIRRDPNDDGVETLTVFKDREAISTMSRDLDGDELDFSVDVTLPCDEKHLLSLKGIDFAGNESEAVNLNVWCDSRPPLLTLKGSKYRQEISGAEINFGPGAPKVALEKYIHNMDEDSDNLPTLRFSVDDQTNRTVGSYPKHIAVEYAYDYDGGGGTQRRQWERLPVNDAGQYELKLSYQRLLPHAFKTMHMAQRRERNFVALASDSDVHTVYVRATDEYKNRSEPEAFTFKLAMRSSPVKVDCTVDPHVKDARLEPPTAVALAQMEGSVFGVKYNWKAPAAKDTSWAPQRGSISVTSQQTAPLTWVVVKKEMQTKRVVNAVDCRGKNVFCQGGRSPAWHIRFDDEECSVQDHPLQGAAEEGDKTTSSTVDSHDVLAQTSTALFGGAQSVHYDSELQQAYHARSTVPLSVVTDAYGRQRTQVFGRSGAECHWTARSVGGNTLEQHHLATKVQVRRPPLTGHQVAVFGNFPPPATTVLGERCKKTAVVEFENDNAPRVFYE